MTGHPIDVLIIGMGMYVCGRGTNAYGTVLPAVLQAQREGLVGRILAAGTHVESVGILQDKVSQLNRQLGTTAHVETFPKKQNNPDAYREALDTLGPRGCTIVAVPDHLHARIAKTVLLARRPVLLVKPFTPTVQEAHELVNMAREFQVYGAVEFHKRWDAANRQLHTIIAEKRLGTPLYALVEFSQRKQIPEMMFRKWAEHTNVFQYLGVHYVDLLGHVLQARPQRVMALGQSAYLSQQSIATFDAIEAMVEWAVPGSTVPFLSTFLTNWIDPNGTSAMSTQSLKVIGTLGRYESDQKHRGLQIVTDAGGIEDVNPYFTQASIHGNDGHYEYRGYGIESIRSYLEDVQQLFDGGTSLEALEAIRPTFRQGVRSTAVIEAARKSLETNGQWVPVSGLDGGHA